MLKPEQIAAEFNARMTVFFQDTEQQRAEAAIMQKFYDGHPTLGAQSNAQWEKLNHKPENPTKRRYANAPIAPAIIKHIVGMMSQAEKQFTAYNVNSSLDPQAFTMRQGLRYVDAITHRESVKKEQIKRAAIMGVAGTVASLDFMQDDAPEGLPSYELKRDVFYDTGLSGCVDSDKIAWCGYADPMKSDALDDYIAGLDKRLDVPASSDFRAQLLEYNYAENQMDLDFLYVYFWQELRKVWDVENVLQKHHEDIMRVGEQFPQVFNLLGELAGKLQLDLNESHFILADDDRKTFYDALENIEFMTGDAIKFDLSESSRMGKAYYRAEFANNTLLTASRSFTQSCHAMSFIGVEYDGTLNYHYGLMRPLAYYQRMLNDAVDDMMLYSGRAARGGTKIVSGAGVDAARLKKYFENDEEVFFGGKEMSVASVGTPDAAQAHLQTAEFLLRLMPMSLGLNGNLFEQLLQTEKTAEEVRHIQNMISAALSTLQASLDKSTLCDGWIFRDMVFEIARNLAGSKQLNFVLGDREEVVNLSRKSLSRHYTMRITDRKLSRDEEQARFDMLKDLIVSVVQDPQALLRVAPALIEMSDADTDIKQKLLEALKPQQPSPEQQQMAKAQLEQQQASNRMLNAQAAQLEQQSGREASASDLNARKAAVEIDKAAADIDLKYAQKTKTEADAAKVIADIGMAAIHGVRGAEQRA